MKRFYCTICKRVKRVQVLPSVTSNESPVNRTGQCEWHITGRINGKPVKSFTEPEVVQKTSYAPVNRKMARKVGR